MMCVAFVVVITHRVMLCRFTHGGGEKIVLEQLDCCIKALLLGKLAIFSRCAIPM